MTENDVAKVLNKPQLYYRLDDFAYSDEPRERILSGIYELDRDTKGFELGCITIWTGFTNAGKTTVMTMIAKNTIEQGERIFFFNGEQTKEDFKNNLYIQAAKREDLQKPKQYKNSCVEDLYVKKEVATRFEKIYGNKIYIYNNEADRSIDQLIKAMTELRKTQKIKVFFLDNFMQIDMKSENIFQEQTNAMEKLRTFAVNTKSHIHLVAHPRKTERFQTRLSLYDVAGSSNIVNKAYNIISIVRVDNLDKNSTDYEKMKIELCENNYDINNVSTVLEVLKTKGNKCGLVGLTYNAEQKTFIESPILSMFEKDRIKNQINYNESLKGGKKSPWNK